MDPVTDGSSDHDPTPTAPPLPPQMRYSRRLSDKILIAFHHACDQGDIKVARDLLSIFEFMEKRPKSHPGRERRSAESLVAAYERLWLLQTQLCRGAD